jgi:hypothetical protein
MSPKTTWQQNVMKSSGVTSHVNSEKNSISETFSVSIIRDQRHSLTDTGQVSEMLDFNSKLMGAVAQEDLSFRVITGYYTLPESCSYTPYTQTCYCGG